MKQEGLLDISVCKLPWRDFVNLAAGLKTLKWYRGKKYYTPKTCEIYNTCARHIFLVAIQHRSRRWLINYVLVWLLTVADPDLELRRGPVFFFCPGPSPRSATDEVRIKFAVQYAGLPTTTILHRTKNLVYFLLNKHELQLFSMCRYQFHAWPIPSCGLLLAFLRRNRLFSFLTMHDVRKLEVTWTYVKTYLLKFKPQTWRLALVTWPLAVRGKQVNVHLKVSINAS